MPVPLPDVDHERLGPPDRDEVQVCLDGVLTAIDPGTGPTDLQTLLVQAAFTALTGHEVEPDGTVSASDLATALADRNEAFRTRILQTMILAALVARPLPPPVAAAIREYASELSVDDGMLAVAERFAEGQFGLAAVDFERNGYTADWSPESADALHTSRPLQQAWDQSVDDPELAARWRAFEQLGADTLGRRMWEFYTARGFSFPGEPGSAPPLLAQHDFVHVLVDYGTKVESELEVFAFIARANDDPRGFSLLAMVVSLFETGNLATGAGLFEASPGQLARTGMAERVADAMRRGALSHGVDEPDVDFLALDWFELADRSVDDLRERFGIVPKADSAVEAGSVGPWEPGGISEFQFASARRSAEAAGRPYDSHGARP